MTRDLDDWITAALTAAPFALCFGILVNQATWWPAPVLLALTAGAEVAGAIGVFRMLRAGRI